MDLWPNSDKSTWIDIHGALSQQSRLSTAGTAASVIMAIAPLSWSNQIVCLPCMAGASRKCHSSPLPSVYARMACFKRWKVDEENRSFKEEWTEKCMFILSSGSSKPVIWWIWISSYAPKMEHELRNFNFFVFWTCRLFVLEVYQGLFFYLVWHLFNWKKKKN